jgi:hypothetical protein
MAKKLLKYAQTESPTEALTEAQTEALTESQTEALTEALTEAPTESQTESPTEAQTEAPTEALTEAPTEALTESPTEALTDAQTFNQPICSSVTCSTFGNPSGFTIGLTISGSITVLKSNLFTHFSAASLSSRSLFIWSTVNAFVSGLNSYLLHLSSLRLKCAQICE